MVLISKNVYIDKLVVHSTNRIIHIIEPFKWSLSIFCLANILTSNIENHGKDPKIEVGDHVKLLTYKNFLQKTNQTEFGIEKVMKKVINFMLSRKVMIIYLIAALIKKSQNFPKPYERCGRNVKVELNLSN